MTDFFGHLEKVICRQTPLLFRAVHVKKSNHFNILMERTKRTKKNLEHRKNYTIFTSIVDNSFIRVQK